MEFAGSNTWKSVTQVRVSVSQGPYSQSGRSGHPIPEKGVWKSNVIGNQTKMRGSGISVSYSNYL